MLNIGGDKADRSYRYKMPPLQTKIEGRGGNTKTIVLNMPDVAKALHVPATYPTKYFGIELGAQTSYDNTRDVGVINGAHVAGDLQKILEKFIDSFVLCPTCKLPELNMSVKKDRIKIGCAACGHNSIFENGHRLMAYILNNPPKVEESKELIKTKNKKEKEKSDFQQLADVKVSEVKWFTDTSEDAQKNRRDDEFGSLMEGVEKLDQIDALIAEAKLTKSDNAPHIILKIFLIQKEKATVNEVFMELKRLQISREMDEPTKVKTLLETFIDSKNIKTVIDQFVQNSKYWQKYIVDEQSAMMFINCLEDFVGIQHPDLLSRFPLILKALYEADVLEEDAILAWYDSPVENAWFVDADVGKLTRTKSTPFVEWLLEEDEDDEE